MFDMLQWCTLLKAGPSSGSVIDQCCVQEEQKHGHYGMTVVAVWVEEASSSINLILHTPVYIFFKLLISVVTVYH